MAASRLLELLQELADGILNQASLADGRLLAALDQALPGSAGGHNFFQQLQAQLQILLIAYRRLDGQQAFEQAISGGGLAIAKHFAQVAPPPNNLAGFMLAGGIELEEAGEELGQIILEALFELSHAPPQAPSVFGAGFDLQETFDEFRIQRTKPPLLPAPFGQPLVPKTLHHRRIRPPFAEPFRGRVDVPHSPGTLRHPASPTIESVAVPGRQQRPAHPHPEPKTPQDHPQIMDLPCRSLFGTALRQGHQTPSEPVASLMPQSEQSVCFHG